MGQGKGPMLASPFGPFGVVAWDRQPKQAFHTLKKYGENGDVRRWKRQCFCV